MLNTTFCSRNSVLKCNKINKFKDLKKLCMMYNKIFLKKISTKHPRVFLTFP